MENDRGIRIEAKLDKIEERISSIDSTLAAQHESLKDHMRRTELLEIAIEPLKKDSAMVHGALKFLGAIAVAASVIEVIFKLIGKI